MRDPMNPARGLLSVGVIALGTAFLVWNYGRSMPWPLLVFLGVFLVFFALLIARSIKGQQHLNLGTASYGRARFLEAVEHHKRALRWLPRNPVVHLNIGLTELVLWRLAAAAKSIERAHGVVPGTVATHLAFIAALRNDEPELRRWSRRMLELKTDDTAMGLLARAVTACRAGRFAEAKTLLEQRQVIMLAGPSRELSQILLAWAVHETSGERRHVSAESLFGEGSAQELETGFPALVAFIGSASSASQA